MNANSSAVNLFVAGLRRCSASEFGLLRRVTDEFQVATVMVTHDTEFVPLTDAVAVMRDGGMPVPALPGAGAAG